MKKTKLLVLFVFTPFMLLAQSKLYVGVEANFVKDHYLITDEGNGLNRQPRGMWKLPGASFLLGYQFNPYLSIETGLSFRPMTTGYSLEEESTLLISRGGKLFYQVPLRIRSRVPIYRDWLFASANMGMQFGFSNFILQDEPNISSNSGSSSISSNSETILSYSSISTSYNTYFTLVGGGIGLEFLLQPNLSLYTDLNYYRGFKTIHQIDVNYQIRNQPEYNWTVTHQGTNVYLSLGLRCRFNTKNS